VDPTIRPADAALSAPADCPFCPGADGELSEILQEVPGAAGWRARAVANRYPFLGPDEGRQEVLVDTPRHDRAFANLSPDEVRSALDLYRDRVRASHRDHPGWEVHLFRNQGRDAGTSRTHPHAQLVVVRGPTPGRQALEDRLTSYHEELGTCAVCATLASSGGLGGASRVAAREVLRGRHFMAATLHAPLDPCHLRIFPTRHTASLAAAHDEEVTELAALLPRLLRVVEAATGGAAWNLLFHGHGSSENPALHWHMELRPRLGRTAGFEQMSESGVCPSDPEDDARRLRTILENTPTI
jgi:UDPglucose--hexose-1-phosphate uridylyltransferase